VSALAGTWMTALAEEGTSTEPERIRRAQRGDEEAREELARSSRRAAYRFALVLTRDPEDAAEIAQEAVLRVFGALGRFDGERPLEPWLLRITRNLVRDRWRRRRARPAEELPEHLADALVAPPAESDPERRTSLRERQRLVWRALSELPEEMREIVVLRDYEDRSYSEIAAVLEIPAGTVMSRLHRARARLAAGVHAALAGREEVHDD